MILGILSDTHGRTEMMRRGVAALQAAGAEYIIHCGDVGEPAMLDELAGIPAAFVWGNCDLDRPGLQQYAAMVGVRCLGAWGIVELAGKKIAVIHGDNDARKHLILSGQEVDYLLQGHTHLKADQTAGKIRIINPGALQRAMVKTVAVLNLSTGALRWLEIDPG